MMKPLLRQLRVWFLAGGIVISARAGELAWVELVTSGAPEQAAPFYEKTFGWTSERKGAGAWDAVVFLRGGKPVAGVSHRAGEKLGKARARWVGFFKVNATDAAGRATEAAGGRVLDAVYAGSAPEGRQALLADRENAAFGVIERAGGADVSARGFWPVMLAVETPVMTRFYRDVLGGEITLEERTPLFAGDFKLEQGGRPWAGVQPTGVGARAGWMILIGVADIDATVKTARKEGARVLREPLVDLIGGRVAVLADPLGGVFGLYESIPVRPRKAKAGEGEVFEVEALSR